MSEQEETPAVGVYRAQLLLTRALELLLGKPLRIFRLGLDFQGRPVLHVSENDGLLLAKEIEGLAESRQSDPQASAEADLEAGDGR